MEKLYHYDDSVLYRFSCSCLSADHSMDVFVEKVGENDTYITLYMNFADTSLFSRVKYAWQIVRGWWTWRDFVIREDDHKNLVDIFKAEKFDKLP